MKRYQNMTLKGVLWVLLCEAAAGSFPAGSSWAQITAGLCRSLCRSWSVIVLRVTGISPEPQKTPTLWFHRLWLVTPAAASCSALWIQMNEKMTSSMRVCFTLSFILDFSFRQVDLCLLSSIWTSPLSVLCTPSYCSLSLPSFWNFSSLFLAFFHTFSHQSLCVAWHPFYMCVLQ